MRLADQPWGPWSEPVDVADGVLGAQGEKPYFAKAQKMLEQENGRTMYVTYYPAALWDHIGPGEAFNDLVRNRTKEVSRL